MGVGEAWWHPEEIPWLSRSRNITPLTTIMTIKKIDVGMAWWHSEEMPWLSRSRSIMPPYHNNEKFENVWV